MAGLKCKYERAIRVGHPDKVCERGCTSRIHGGFWNDAQLRILKTATPLEHIRSELQCLVVEAQRRVVSPIICRRCSVHSGIERVVPPTSARVGGLRHGNQEPSLLTIIMRGGQQHPTVGVLVV